MYVKYCKNERRGNERSAIHNREFLSDFVTTLSHPFAQPEFEIFYNAAPINVDSRF